MSIQIFPSYTELTECTMIVYNFNNDRFCFLREYFNGEEILLSNDSEIRSWIQNNVMSIQEFLTLDRTEWDDDTGTSIYVMEA